MSEESKEKKRSWFKKFLKGIKLPGQDYAIEKTYKGKTKMAQDKLIENYVNQQKSKLSSPDRSVSNVIREQEKLDKEIKNKLRKKGIYEK